MAITHSLQILFQAVTPPNWQDDYAFFCCHICRFLTTKDKFHGFIDSESTKRETTSENDKVEEKKESPFEEPEAKKPKLETEERSNAGKPDGKRLRGQNKSRPHIKPTTYEEKRLCLSVIKVQNFSQPFTNATYSNFRTLCHLILVIVMTFSIHAGQ